MKYKIISLINEIEATLENNDKSVKLPQNTYYLSNDRILLPELFYKTLEECGELKFNYNDYVTTHPINYGQAI